jgi:outer membrane protein assembly factor BamB
MNEITGVRKKGCTFLYRLRGGDFITMNSLNSRIVSIIIFFSLCLVVVPCMAIEPTWTVGETGNTIESLVVAPDGSSVVAGAGKVLLFSQDGTLLAKEPFGELIIQTRDGSSIVTAYSSMYSSTIYLFKKVKGEGGKPTLQKVWETNQPDKAVSIAISDTGDRVASAAGGGGVYIFNGKTGSILWHNTTQYSALIAMAAKGSPIAGIFPGEGLKLYSSTLKFPKKFDISVTDTPKSFFVTANGGFAVFNDAQKVVAIGLGNGSELWKRRASGDVNMLAMTPEGDHIVAGTEIGTIDLYDAKGNLTWTYNSAIGTGNGQAIEAVAVTQDASRILAGSFDGKIILLDSAGNPLWIYNTTKDHIRHVAVAADGSLAVASGDNKLYAFSMGGVKSTAKAASFATPLPTTLSISASPASSESPGTTMTAPAMLQTLVTKTPTATITEYSVVRTATKSPLPGITGIASLLIVLFLISRNNRGLG